MLIEVARVEEIAPGGMKFVEACGRELLICNCDGRFYAIDRRCGHMNGPLELGALDGTIVTCPMHHVQFDVTTGEPLNRPIMAHIEEALPPQWGRYMAYFGMLMDHTNVRPLRIFAVNVDGNAISVDI
jgi:nitrite reductase/ring-hydroxylating ferredoxin subunit